MASGSWGGDGRRNPASPSHMGAWAKEFLGWVTPRVIESDQLDVKISPILNSGNVVRVDYDDLADPTGTKYLLLEYRKQDGFDELLTGAGLLLSEVNNTKVQAGLIDNSVNDSQFDMGVNIVIEADGKRELRQ